MAAATRLQQGLHSPKASTSSCLLGYPQCPPPEAKPRPHLTLGSNVWVRQTSTVQVSEDTWPCFFLLRLRARQARHRGRRRLSLGRGRLDHERFFQQRFRLLVFHLIQDGDVLRVLDPFLRGHSTGSHTQETPGPRAARGSKGPLPQRPHTCPRPPGGPFRGNATPVEHRSCTRPA